MSLLLQKVTSIPIWASLLLLACQLASGQTGESSFKPDIRKPASLNLKSILEHQAALELECANLQKLKVNQVENLYKSIESDGKLKVAPNPLMVEVPAVCLFVFSQFGRAEPMSVEAKPSKLKLVNWIYNIDELKLNSRQDNMTKRQVESGEAPEETVGLLDEYLLRADVANEIDEEPAAKRKLHEDLSTLMADSRFQQVIEQNRERIAGHLSPVILVPGLLGSRLQAKTKKPQRMNIFCSKQSDWQEVWLSLRQLFPLAVDCWLDNVRLEYDPNTRFTRLPNGVETRVPDFGSVESVRHLDLRQPTISQYFSTLIELYLKLGYTLDKNLLAAPYDFRLAPQELTGFFVDLKQLIERARANSPTNKKVTLVCHSMGCTHLLVFLRLQSAAWRQGHVRKLIALSSPWGGATKALKALVVGDQLDLPLVSEAKMRKLARSYPSIAFLLPQPEVYERPNKDRVEHTGPVLVQTPERTYRARDLPDLMEALNLTKQFYWFKATTSLIQPLKPLADLTVDCIHSLNTPTPETIIFKKLADFPDGPYELVKGDGDGTVNLESLLVCQDWASKLPHKVTHKVIMNTNHMGVLSHPTTLSHITDDVLINSTS